MKGFVNEGICQLGDLLMEGFDNRMIQTKDLLMEGFDNRMIHKPNISIWRSSLLIYIFLD